MTMPSLMITANGIYNAQVPQLLLALQILIVLDSSLRILGVKAINPEFEYLKRLIPE